MIPYGDLMLLPYRRGAWLASDGAIDCWGLALECMRRMGGAHRQFVEDFHESFGRQQEADALWLSMPARFDLVERPQEGDLLTMTGDGMRHVLIYLSPTAVLHCSEKLGPHVLRWSLIKPWITAIYRLRVEVTC